MSTMNAQKKRERYATDPEYREKERERGRERYRRMKKLVLEKTGPKARPAEERFWEKVQKGKGPEDCWEWLGASRRKSGYATLSVNGVSKPVKNFSYELHFGPLQSDEYVRIGCRNKNCVNPDHLYIGNLDEVRNPKIVQLDSEEALARAQANAASTRIYYQTHKEERQRYTQEYQIKRKLRAMIYLGGECRECQQEPHPNAAQFHHRDPSTKLFNITTKELGSPKKYPWNVVEAELDKCDLLCSNCHFIRHGILDAETINRLREEVREEVT